MSTHVKELTTENFDTETASGLVVIDFWAPWCGPCRTMGPIFEAVAEKVGDKATFVKVNVDDAADVAARFGVRSIPTLIVLKDGAEAETSTGVMRPDDLIAMLDRNA